MQKELLSLVLKIFQKNQGVLVAVSHDRPVKPFSSPANGHGRESLSCTRPRSLLVPDEALINPVLVLVFPCLLVEGCKTAEIIAPGVQEGLLFRVLPF